MPALVARWRALLSSTGLSGGGGGGGVAAFDIVYNGDVAGAGPITGPQTFASVPFGTAAAGRVVALIITTYIQDAVPITAVTIGGVTAAKQVGTNNVPDPQNGMEIWSAVVPTGTSGNVVITGATGSTNFYGLYPYSIYGAGSATVFDTGVALGGQPLQDTGFTGPAGGGGISYALILGATPTLNWNGATQTFLDQSGTDTNTSAKQLFVDATSGPAMRLSWDGSGAAFYALFASWAPTIAGAALLLDDGGHMLLSGGGRLLLG